MLAPEIWMLLLPVTVETTVPNEAPSAAMAMVAL
jgi:hypothetical protein